MLHINVIVIVFKVQRIVLLFLYEIHPVFVFVVVLLEGRYMEEVTLVELRLGHSRNRHCQPIFRTQTLKQFEMHK